MWPQNGLHFIRINYLVFCPFARLYYWNLVSFCRKAAFLNRESFPVLMTVSPVRINHTLRGYSAASIKNLNTTVNVQRTDLKGDGSNKCDMTFTQLVYIVLVTITYIHSSRVTVIA